MLVLEVDRKLHLPRGKGGNLNRCVSGNEDNSAALVMLSEVQNTVLWVNKGFSYAPFNLKVGEPTPLGLFAKSEVEAYMGNVWVRDSQQAEVWPEHHRSALLSRMLIVDDDWRIYRDIDIKGIGAMAKSSHEMGFRYRNGSFNGLVSRKFAEHDRDLSEQFLASGIRTARTLAIIGLKEIIVGNKKVSLGELKEKLSICEEFDPVVQIRCFGTKARVKDLRSPWTHFGNLLFSDAKKLVGQELGWKRSMAGKEYLDWFAKALGRNVGLMHGNGWTHKYLNAHNITLDCRIVDLDSVDPLETRGQLEIDFCKAIVMSSAFHLSSLSFSHRRLGDLFSQSYKEIFPPEEQMDYFRKTREDLINRGRMD